MPTFFENKTDDGSGTVIDWNGNCNPGTLQIVGVWDGATVEITGSMNRGSNYTAPVNSSYTDDVITTFEMATGKVKATISNAGASTNLSAYISPG
jgi:hypothetical protein